MSRAPLESLDNPESTGRPSRVLSRGSPFGALVVAPGAGRHRLREVETALAAPSEALAARGVRPPPRATRAEAHERRPAARSPSLWATLDARGQAMAPGHGCRFTNPLLAWDSTTLARGWHLCPGARCRTATGARQGPTLLEHAGPLPAVVVMTAGPRRAIAIARGLQLPQGSLVALDRGDLAAQVLCRRTQDRVSGVTRQQVQATYPVTACLAVHWRPGVTSDQHLGLQGHTALPTLTPSGGWGPVTRRPATTRCSGPLPSS